MRTKLLAAISASILILLAVVTPDPGAAATVGPIAPQLVTLEGPTVIDYESLQYKGQYLYLHPTFVASERLIRQGIRRVDGGCTFTRSVRISAAQAGPLTELELAYDPATCRSLVEIGRLAHAQQLTLGTGALERGSRSFGTISSSGATGGHAALPSANGTRYLAYREAMYEEPARWVFCIDPTWPTCGLVRDSIPPVNRIKNEVEWTPDGVCATLLGTTSWSRYEWEMLVLTGWYLGAHLWDPQFPCEYIQSVSWIYFKNDLFCQAVYYILVPPDVRQVIPPPAQTQTWYWPNTARGYPDGSATLSTVESKVGGCSDFLRFWATSVHTTVP